FLGVAVQRRVGIQLDFHLAGQQLLGHFLEFDGALTLGGLIGDDVTELDGDGVVGHGTGRESQCHRQTQPGGDCGESQFHWYAPYEQKGRNSWVTLEYKMRTRSGKYYIQLRRGRQPTGQ